MILIVASHVDDAARRLQANLPAGSARLLTPLDLSEPGWRVFPARSAANLAIAGGRPLDPGTLTGVVCLLPRIFPDELVQIEDSDRAYVAAEMTAFLTFWLSTLDCRKLNPPTAGCMSGPSWSVEHWLSAAASVGLDILPLSRTTRSIANIEPTAGRSLTVVGTRSLGDGDPALVQRATTLAARAGVDLLTVRFADVDGRACVTAADPFPDLSEPRAAAAIHHFFNDQSAT